MVLLSACPGLLTFMSLLASTPAISAPLIQEAQVDGVRLPYVEHGSGEPIVLVHGAFSDLRIWELLREGIASKYRFIAFTQRYFGTAAWPDDGKNFNVETHADDLAKFVTRLNAGPVHLVTRSYGGLVATRMALGSRSLVRSLTLHEPALLSVLSADSEEGKSARADRIKHTAEAMAANKAGDAVRTVRLFFEGVYQLGPGGFDRLPQATQTMLLENARTAPLQFGALRSLPITCEALKAFTQPTLITRGERTHAYYRLINEGVVKCIPAARQVTFPNLVHDAPSRDPAAFTSALFEFLEKLQWH
jgi:pimeloyl-ACP methyl ester carboxylesterase